MHFYSEMRNLIPLWVYSGRIYYLHLMLQVRYGLSSNPITMARLLNPSYQSFPLLLSEGTAWRLDRDKRMPSLESQGLLMSTRALIQICDDYFPYHLSLCYCLSCLFSLLMNSRDGLTSQETGLALSGYWSYCFCWRSQWCLVKAGLSSWSCEHWLLPRHLSQLQLVCHWSG